MGAKKFLLLACLFGSLSLSAQDWGNLKFTTYTTRDGLPSNIPQDLIRDPRGFLWITTENGISRFDGVSFRNYVFPDGAKNGALRLANAHLAYDQRGKLWFGNALGLGFYDQQADQFHYYHPADSSLTSDLIDLCSDGKNTVWLTSMARGLVKLNTLTMAVEPTNMAIHAMGALHCDPAGNVWANAYRRGVYHYDVARDTFRFYPMPADVNDFWQEHKNAVWLASVDGLRLLDPESGNVQVFNPTELLPDAKPFGAYHFALFPNRTGDRVLWMTTQHDGILLFDLDKRRFITRIGHEAGRPGSLPVNNLRDLLPGEDGILWVAGYQGGLCKYDPHDQEFQAPDLPFLAGFPELDVSRLVRDPRDPEILWAGIYGGGLVKFDMTRKQVRQWFFFDPKRKDKTPECRVSDLYIAADQRLWVATGKGLYASPDGRHFTFYPLRDGGGNWPAQQLRPDAAGQLWVNTGTGAGVFNPQTGAFHHYAVAKMSTAMHIAPVKNLLVDRRGQVWVSGLKGLTRLDPASGALQTFTPKPTHSMGNMMIGAAEDARGRIWFGSHEGFGMFDPVAEKFTLLPDSLGMGENTCYQVFFDKKGDLWVVSQMGLFRYKPDKQELKEFLTPGGIAQLTIVSHPVFGVSPLGEDIFITLANHRYRFNPALADLNDRPAQPVLYGLRVNNNAQSFDAASVATTPYQLDYFENNLAFDFTAFNYTRPEAMAFRYMLENFDPAPVAAGQLRMANYTNLAPGRYTFKVWAANSAGIWNDQPAVFLLRINPPFWTTGWFIGLIALGVVAGVWWWLNNRIRRIRSQAEIREREAGYKQREAELRQEVAEFQKEVAEVELAALRAQMNPHFVFNCLNSINTFILLNDSKQASTYLNKFSKLIRRVLDASRAEYISLRDELDTLRYYIELEQMRYGDRFRYQIRLPETLDPQAVELPPMLVQPFVENAIWHGLMHREGNDGLIAIDISLTDHVLQFVIEDNGIGRRKAAELKSKSAAPHKSHGLNVTTERLKVINELYGTSATVRTEDLFDAQGAARGTRVTVSIPVRLD